MTSDPAGARAFYTGLFGWTADEANEEFGGYFTFFRDGVRVAGAFPKMPGTEGMPDVWSIYLATDNAEKTVETATAEGGQVVAPAMAVGDLGTMAVITDPGGAAIGMWQPGVHKGFGVLTEAGAPSWFELHTRDYDGAINFYRNVFGWDTRTMSDTPELHYTVMDNPAGEGELAGIMDASAFLPEGVPSYWIVYFGSDDADATVAKTVELGGSVVRPAEDTPYGRLAVLADPTGAKFSIVAPNDQMPAR
jgi:predicted enzyme related to lactoylglutathione lyase